MIRVAEAHIVVSIHDARGSDLGVGYVSPVEDWVVDKIGVADSRDRLASMPEQSERYLGQRERNANRHQQQE